MHGEVLSSIEGGEKLGWMFAHIVPDQKMCSVLVVGSQEFQQWRCERLWPVVEGYTIATWGRVPDVATFKVAALGT